MSTACASGGGCIVTNGGGYRAPYRRSYRRRPSYRRRRYGMRMPMIRKYTRRVPYRAKAYCKRVRAKTQGRRENAPIAAIRKYGVTERTTAAAQRVLAAKQRAVDSYTARVQRAMAGPGAGQAGAQPGMFAAGGGSGGSAPMQSQSAFASPG
jgi:hypothetical protein